MPDGRWHLFAAFQRVFRGRPYAIAAILAQQTLKDLLRRERQLLVFAQEQLSQFLHGTCPNPREGIAGRLL